MRVISDIRLNVMTVYILQPVGLSGRMMMIKLEISFLCFPVETTSGLVQPPVSGPGDRRGKLSPE